MSATSATPATTGNDPFVPRGDPPASPWLAALLNNAKNRDTLARLESGLITFMHDRDKVHLELPPCSRFKRRVYVEVAQRFRLEHRLDRPPDATDPDAVLLVLLKSPQSAIPTTMLSSLMPPNEKPVLVKRPTGRPRANGEAAAGSCSAGNASAARKKVSQEEYEQARARIFRASGGGASASGTGANATTRGTVDVLAPSNPGGTSATGCKLSGGGPLSASSSVSSGAQSNPDNTEQAPSVNVRIVGGGIARGPEEGKSFARRRGRSGNGATNGARSAILDHRVDSSVSAGLKVNCGSEGADKDDPDFDRRYDKWAVRSQAAGPPPQQHPPLLYGVPPPPSTMYSYAIHHHRAMSHAEAHAHAAAQAQFPLQMYHMAAAAAAAQPPPTPPPYFAQANPNMTNSATTANGARFATTSSSLPHITAAAAPSYGLDNATDFPPLSAKGGGGANSKHRR